MLGLAPGKVVLILKAIQFFCEASYGGRGREGGDALCCTVTPGPKFSIWTNFFGKKRTGGTKIFNENFGPRTVFAGTKIPVTGRRYYRRGRRTCKNAAVKGLNG